MSMYKLVVVAMALVLAGCRQDAEAPPSQPEAPVTPAPPAADVPAPEPVVAENVPELTLPEGFKLPFVHSLLNENVLVTEDGKPQHRIFVEFQDDAGAVENLLVTALGGAGFTSPTISSDGAQRILSFARNDGSSVIVRINPELAQELKKSPDAKGTVHLTWTGP